MRLGQGHFPQQRANVVVQGAERADVAELAEELGVSAHNVLHVAIALGYEASE